MKTPPSELIEKLIIDMGVSAPGVSLDTYKRALLGRLRSIEHVARHWEAALYQLRDEQGPVEEFDAGKEDAR